MEQQCSVGRFCKLTTLAHRCSITTNPMLQQGITLRLLSRQSRPNCPNPLPRLRQWRSGRRPGMLVMSMSTSCLCSRGRRQLFWLIPCLCGLASGINGSYLAHCGIEKNMRGDYNDALNQRQTLAFQDSLKMLFAD